MVELGESDSNTVQRLVDVLILAFYIEVINVRDLVKFVLNKYGYSRKSSLE